MDEELMMNILSLGSDEEAIAELLRQAERQEGIADDTRGNDYLINAGRVNVANPWGAVSDMFVRGNAEKKAEAARGQVPNRRAAIDEKMRDFVNSSLNKGIGGIDMNNQAPTQAAIAGSTPMPMPQVPPIAPPAPPQAPAPAAPPAPAPGAPTAPMAPAGRPGPFLANLPPQEDDIQAILAKLREQQPGGIL